LGEEEDFFLEELFLFEDFLDDGDLGEDILA